MGFLQNVKKKPEKPYPSVIALHGTPGWGKTSFGAMLPNPVFLLSKNETGLIKLISEGQVPETAYGPPAEDYDQVLAAIHELQTQPHDFKTLVIDTMNGVEAMFADWVTNNFFGGDSGPGGFGNYGAGKRVVEKEFPRFISQLEQLRAQRGVSILLLYHTDIKTFKNPEGSDYDRYEPKPTPGATEHTIRYADAVLFATYDTVVKGRQGQEIALKGDRIINCQDHPAYVAKSRFSFPPRIYCRGTPKQSWLEIQKQVVEGRARAKAMNQPEESPLPPAGPPVPTVVDNNQNSSNSPASEQTPTHSPAGTVIDPATMTAPGSVSPLVGLVAKKYDTTARPWFSETIRHEISEILGYEVKPGTPISGLTEVELQMLLDAKKGSR